METLVQRCAELGLRVRWTNLPDNLSGCYDHTTSTIWLRNGEPEWMSVPTLMHELIHAHRGDNGHQAESVEKAIDRMVARMLITEQEYELAERISGGRGSGAIAVELDLPHWVVAAYRAELRQRC